MAQLSTKKRQRSHSRAIPANRAPNGTIRAIMAEKQGTFPRERRRRRERRSRRASRSFSQKRRAARLLWTRAYHHGILRAFQRGPPRLPESEGHLRESPGSGKQAAPAGKNPEKLSVRISHQIRKVRGALTKAARSFLLKLCRYLRIFTRRKDIRTPTTTR